MAEIRVQERRGNPLWVWVLILLVVVAAIVWFFMLRDPGPPAASPADTLRSMILPITPDVAFTSFAAAA
jgi:bacteriorhodopsin